MIYRKRFRDGERGIRQYRAYFSKQNWRALDASTMKEHRVMNCLKCSQIPDFQLKKANQTFVRALENNNVVAQQPQTPRACQRLQNEQTQQRRLSLEDIPRGLVRTLYKKMKKGDIPKRLLQKIIKDSMTEENIPKKLKRKIIAKAQAMQRTAAIKKELTTIFLTNTSFKKHDRMRVSQFGSYKRNRVKAHVGPIDSYSFNQEIVRDTFQQVSNGTMDLGRKMTGRWAPLAFSASVRKRFGPQPKILNGGQVGFSLIKQLMFS